MIMSFLLGRQNYESYVTSSTKKVSFCIATDLGQAVETLHAIPLPFRMSTFPAGLLSVSLRDNTTCSQSVKPIRNFAGAQPQKLYPTRER